MPYEGHLLSRRMSSKGAASILKPCGHTGSSKAIPALAVASCSLPLRGAGQELNFWAWNRIEFLRLSHGEFCGFVMWNTKWEELVRASWRLWGWVIPGHGATRADLPCTVMGRDSPGEGMRFQSANPLPCREIFLLVEGYDTVVMYKTIWLIFFYHLIIKKNNNAWDYPALFCSLLSLTLCSALHKEVELYQIWSRTDHQKLN